MRERDGDIAEFLVERMIVRMGYYLKTINTI
jgi:hypothetical protein